MIIINILVYHNFEQKKKKRKTQRAFSEKNEERIYEMLMMKMKRK